MQFTPSPTACLVRDTLAAGATPPELFRALDEAGADIAAAMAVIAEPEKHLGAGEAWEVEEIIVGEWYDPLYALIEHYGLEQASRVAAQIPRWADVDLAARHAATAAWLEAESAMANGSALQDTYALVASPALNDGQRQLLLQRLAGSYPLLELVHLVHRISPSHGETIGSVLARQRPPLAALETLIGEVDDGVLMQALERWWGLPRDPTLTAQEELLATYARLSLLHATRMERVLCFAESRGEQEWWLPILRRGGLRPSRAALWLLERGHDFLAIARALSRAGYSDQDVMSSLLTNGAGTPKSLSLLRSAGWDLHRLLESLKRRGALLPEVRRHLIDLGVPTSTQHGALIRHWDRSSVDLVLGREPATRPRLVPGLRDDGD